MNNIKEIFDDAYEYARLFNDDGKNASGAILIEESGRRNYGSNEEGNVDALDKILKYAVTKKSNRIRFEQSCVYLTDNKLTKETANKIIELKIPELHYCGFSGLDNEVFDILDEKVIIIWHSDLDYSKFSDSYKWWTHQFYENAYEIVKDRKFPVTIPGYNRPALPTIWSLRVKDFTEEENWPFIVIVRESQYDMYVEATKDFKYVTIKSFPDKIINNAGAVRRTTQKWLNSQGIVGTFQMDDDVNYLGYSYASRKEDGYPKAQYIRTKDMDYTTPRVLAMWQIAMEKAMACDNTLISCGQQIAFSWKEDYCQRSNSYQFMRGPMTQVVCFNIKGLCEQSIYHNNNVDVGFDDIDFTLRVIESGNKTACFPWIVYGVEALGGGNGDKVSQDKLRERFKINQDKLKVLHEDKPYVGFRVKRGLDQVCINWRGARRFYVDKFDHREELIKFSCYDIWQDGHLLEEAKRGDYDEI